MTALLLVVEADSAAGWISPLIVQDRCAGRKQGRGVPQHQAAPFLAGVMGNVAMRRKRGQQACPEAVVETG